MKLKRFLACLAGAATAAVLCTAAALSAGAEELTSGYWQYEVQYDNTVQITGYTGFTDKLTIPSKIDGKTVTSIDEYAFENSDGFTSVVIPSTVKDIGYAAFSGSAITSISIPSTVSELGDSVCSDCKNLITADINSEKVSRVAFIGCDKLSTVTLGKNVKYILNSAFYEDKNLSKVTINSDLLEIEEYSFSKCPKLTSVNLGKKLKVLAFGAFEDSGLTSVTIPSTVSEIGSYAFSGCTNLTSATINSKLVDTQAFSYCTSLSTVTLGENVQFLKGEVFYSDKNLSKVITNGNILEIGDYCFAECPSLTSIDLGKRLYRIGDSIFYKAGISSLEVPSSVTEIYDWAFSGCDKLQSVYYGYGATSDNMFYSSPNVHMYCFPGSDALAYAKDNNIPYSLRTAVPATSIKLNKTSAILEVGEELVLNTTLSPSNSNDGVTWTSGDNDVAECRSGIIYARSEGIAAIRAKTTSGKTAVCNVTVINRKPVDVTALGLSSRGSSTLTIKWTPTDTADGYIVEKYVGGKWTRAAKISSKATSAYTVNGLKPSTKYSIRVRSYKMVGSTAVYSAYKSGSWTTNPSAVSGLKLKGRSADALRLSWTKNTSADGYIIERKSGSKWVRVVKITKNSTTEYRIAKLKAGTTYNFRIRTYNMVGSTPLYSGYKTISACTKPSNISGLRLKAAVKNAVRLAWTKNTSAGGYIIEMKSGSKWVRVGKITKNSIVEFKKSGLKSKTSYTFRVKAYKMSGKTALYGATKTITVKTK